MIDISIIMPLYNAEAFLEETLNSVISQTFQNYELICINDASDDGTVSIVEKMMEQDYRIKLYHNVKRSGAAFSRNIGLNIAQGKYVAFLDGDDIFDEEMLEKEYALAEKYQLDVVVCEYIHVPSEEIRVKQCIARDDAYKQKFCKKYFNIYDLEPKDYTRWSNGPCNKLFNMDFIKKNQLEFQSLSSSNDVYFVEMAFILSDKMMFLDDNRVMIYAREHATPTRISYNRDPMCIYAACKKIIMELKRRNILDKSYSYIYLKTYFMLLHGFSDKKSEDKKREFYEFLRSTGIDELKSLGSEYFTKLPWEVQDSYEKFKTFEYETKWFENESRITYFLRQSSHEISKLWEEKRKIIVWGTGKYGKGLIQYLNKNDLKVNAVVDSDKQKAGMMIEGYKISRPQDVTFDNECTVIVAAKGAYESVSKQLNNIEVKLVDLEQLVGI